MVVLWTKCKVTFYFIFLILMLGNAVIGPIFTPGNLCREIWLDVWEIIIEALIMHELE